MRKGTEITERLDGNFNLWGLLKHPESIMVEDEDGKLFYHKTWQVIGVYNDFKEAQHDQRNKYRHL